MLSLSGSMADMQRELLQGGGLGASQGDQLVRNGSNFSMADMQRELLQGRKGGRGGGAGQERSAGSSNAFFGGMGGMGADPPSQAASGGRRS